MCFNGCKTPVDQIETNRFYYQSDYDNECIFVVDKEYVYMKHWEKYEFISNAVGDSLQENIYGKTYKRKELNHSPNMLDSFYLANSRNEILSHQWAWLFNTKAHGLNWIVSLYSFDDIKGTYAFTVTEEEMAIFQDLANSINSDPRRLYSSIDTSRIEIDGPFAATYFAAFCNSKETETFGSIEYLAISALTQFAIIINQKYIKPENKISKTITLMDVRERFNLKRLQVVHTGSVIEDYDSVVKRIYGKQISMDKATE